MHVEGNNEHGGWNRSSLRNDRLKFRKIAHHSRRTYKLYLKLVKKN